MAEFNRARVHELLTRELNAILIPDSDKTVPQKWAEPKQTKEEEEEDMTLFDQLRAAGVDLGGIPTDPFKYDDDTYEMVLISVIAEPPSQDGWNNTLEFTFQFVSGKYKGKPYKIQHQIPTPANWAKNEEEETKRLSATFQRLAQLGVKDPASADVQEINNTFRGSRYMVPLVTATKGKFEGRQFAGIIKPVSDVATGGGVSTDDLFDDEG